MIEDKTQNLSQQLSPQYIHQKKNCQFLLCKNYTSETILIEEKINLSEIITTNFTFYLFKEA